MKTKLYIVFVVLFNTDKHCRTLGTEDVGVLLGLQEEARNLRSRTALGAAVTERWERARLQQHQRHLQVQEAGLRAALDKVAEDHDLELRAHCELVEYLHQATQVRRPSRTWALGFACFALYYLCHAEPPGAERGVADAVR